MGYRRGHGRRGLGRIAAEIDVCHEFDLRLAADVNLGYPPPDVQDHDAPGFSDPGDGGDVDNIRLALTPEQVKAVNVALDFRYGTERRLVDSGVADLVLDILSALDPKFPGEREGEFFEKAGEMAEDRGNED